MRIQKTLILAVAFILGFHATAAMAAKNDAVFCVQSQFNELGFDAGTADGLFGRKTAAAAAAYLAAEGDLGLGELTKVNAGQYCRALGEHHSEATSAYADFIGSRFTLVTDGQSVDAAEQEKLNGYLQEIAEKFAQMGYFPPATVKAYASHDDEWLTKEMVKLVPNWDRGLWSRCSGVAPKADVLVLCLNHDTWSNPNFPYRENDLSVAYHEAGHTAQRALAGDPQGFVGNRPGGVLRIGLQWMIEGVPQVWQRKWMEERGNVNAEADFYTGLNHLRARFSDGVDMKYFSTLGSDNEEIAATVGFVASYLLLQYVDSEADLFRYWEEIGTGKSPTAAFEAAFGLSTEEFYKTLNEVVSGQMTLADI